MIITVEIHFCQVSYGHREKERKKEGNKERENDDEYRYYRSLSLFFINKFPCQHGLFQYGNFFFALGSFHARASKMG